MASHEDVARRWLDVLQGRTSPSGRPLDNYSSSSHNVFGRGDVLYSYGTHFPLAEFYGRGRYGRTSPLFLLNADRVSVTTSRHQNVARAEVARRAAEFGADVLLLPFSALESARILRETIRPLDIRADRWLDEFEDVSAPLDVLETAAETFEFETETSRGTCFRWRLEDGRTLERRHTLFERPYPGAYVAEDGTWKPRETEWRAVDRWRADVRNSNGRVSALELERDEDGAAWRIRRRRHLLGDSLFTAAINGGLRDVSREWTVRDVVSAAVRSITARRERPDGFLDVFETLENVGARMAEGPIIESVPWRPRRRFVSSFDSNEPAPLYFLATLPSSSRARTVAAAIDDLAPTAVHAALARGRAVFRQGDIFAIQTDLSDEDVYALPGATRARLTMWTVSAKPRRGELGWRPPMRAAERRAFSEYRRQVWRDLFRAETARAAERPPILRGARARYRAADLERRAVLERYRLQGRAMILRGALADLAPRGSYGATYRPSTRLEDVRTRAAYVLERRLEPSRTYTADGYRVRRGFALETWRAAHTAALERFAPMANPFSAARAAWREQVRDTVSLFGTSHAATETVRARGGAVYVRGIMRHVPDLERGRVGGRDHIPLPLGDGSDWFLAVRNTVPRSRDARRA